MFLDAEQLGKRHDETIVFTTIRQEYFIACCSIAFAERKVSKSTMGAAAATAPVLPSLAAATLSPCTGVQILTNADQLWSISIVCGRLGRQQPMVQGHDTLNKAAHNRRNLCPRPLVDHHDDLVELVGLCAQKLQMKVEVEQCKPAREKRTVQRSILLRGPLPHLNTWEKFFEICERWAYAWSRTVWVIWISDRAPLNDRPISLFPPWSC